MKHLNWTRWLPLGSAVAAALFIFSGGVAQASSCDTWTGGGGDGMWSTAGNWSTGEVPGNTYNSVQYEPDVCIPAGSYTVLLNYSTTADSISVGAGSTLEIWGQQNYTHGGLTLNNQANGTGIASGADVVLGIGTNTNNTHGGFDTLSGTLVNDGSITSATTGDETQNFIDGSFDNVGTLTIDNDFQGTVGSWTLGGTVNVASGQTMAMSGPNSGSATVTLTGTVIDNGSLSFGNAINVTAVSGTDSGNPIVLGNGTLTPTGSGSGTFHIMSGGAQLGGNIASGYTVWMSGQPNYSQGDTTTTGSYTNYGTLELGSSDGTHGTLTMPAGDTFTNDATIVSETTGDETQNGIDGNFVNAGTLTVDNNLQGAVGSWTLGGTVNITSGQAVTVAGPNSGSGSVTLTGTLINNGSLSFGDAVNVTAASGTDSGNPIVLGNGILSPSGSGSGTFHIMDGGGQLGSNIASGYTVWGSGIPGYSHGDITATGSYTNYGSLELGSLDGTHGTLTVPSGNTFTNDGTLIFENTANGPDGLSGALVNNGSVSVQNTFQGSGAIINDGTFELTAASGTNNAASFTQGSGGTLKVDVTGGTSPVVPQLDLSSTATTAGRLVVSTTGGTATGTFPVIEASQQSGVFGTSFTGESYTLGYKNGTVSLTGPAAAAGTTPSTTAITQTATTMAKAPTVTSISSGHKGTVVIKLECSKGANCTSYSVRASIKLTEKLHGRKQTVTETVAKRTGTVDAGKSVTLKLAVGAAREALLRAHSALKVSITVSTAGRVLKSKTVTIRK